MAPLRRCNVSYGRKKHWPLPWVTQNGYNRERQLVGGSTVQEENLRSTLLPTGCWYAEAELRRLQYLLRSGVLGAAEGVEQPARNLVQGG